MRGKWVKVNETSVVYMQHWYRCTAAEKVALL